MGLEDWEKKLDKTDAAFERYRASGFELVATTITLSAGTLGVFHKALAPLEIGLLFLPIGVALIQQRCRYQGLKEYAHARLAAMQLVASDSKLASDGAGVDGINVNAHKSALLEYLGRSDESNRWFKYADDLCDFALLLLFLIGAGLFFVHIAPAIRFCGR
jgi:hypothetical protein